MSTVPDEAASTTGEPLANLLFDFPGADVILRSQDSYHFRVPKIYIFNSSSVLGELIQRTLDSPDDANAGASLPVVKLPKRGEIVHCLLTHIFPVPPLVPSTHEEIMELLSDAQEYQMDSALIHIRDKIARQYPLPVDLEPALRIYSFAQKYGLRQEALQTARTISNYPMTIEDLDNKLDIMPGASLYELWKYREAILAILVRDLIEFRRSCAHGTITDLRCTEHNSSGIPRWLDDYIRSIGKTPNLFDLVEFNIAMVRHTNGGAKEGCECASMPSQTIREFWEALASVVHGGFEKAGTTLCLIRDLEGPETQISSATSILEPFDVPDANMIIRSSDFVNFRVHKPVLAMASSLFKDLLSLPQPPDSEIVNGLPVVQLSESSELLNGLISMLYPVRKVTPNSYKEVLYLLAACQKYEMASVQSSIRAEVERGGFPAPKGAESFSAYAIASANGLIPGMENAARLTLNHPMTFEALGERLRLFDGCALRDLVNFRRCCRDSLIACFDTFMKAQPPAPSSIWVGCPEDIPTKTYRPKNVLPKWFNQLLLRIQNDLKVQKFTHPLDIHLRIRQEYLKALQKHAHCNYCLKVHIRSSSTLCAELENKLAEARDKAS